MLLRVALAALVAAPFASAQPGAFRLGGTSLEVGRAVDIADDGAVALAARYFFSFDADPGPGETLLPSSGAEDGMVAVYESSGALRFAVPLVSSGSDDIYDVAFLPDGGVAVIGHTGDVMDLDPGSGELLVEAPGFEVRIFVAVYGPDGALRYGFGLEGVTFVQEGAIDGRRRRQRLLAATLDGTTDFDPGSGDASRTGTADAVVASYSADGSLRWVNVLEGGTTYARGLSVAGDRLALAVSLSGTTDLDPGSGMAEIESNGSIDVLVVSGRTSGAIEAGFTLGGRGADVAFDVAVDETGRTAVLGRIQSPTDLDPGPGEVVIGTDGGGILGAPFIGLYDSDGGFRFAANLGALAVSGIALEDGRPVYSGSLPSGDYDVDPSAGTDILTTTDGFDGVVVALEADGSLRWARSVTGPGGGDNTLAVAVRDDGTVATTGRFTRTATLAPGVTLTSDGTGDDIFVASYFPDGTLISGTPTASDDLEVDRPSLATWPNPSAGVVTIRSRGAPRAGPPRGHRRAWSRGHRPRGRGRAGCRAATPGAGCLPRTRCERDRGRDRTARRGAIAAAERLDLEDAKSDAPLGIDTECMIHGALAGVDESTPPDLEAARSSPFASVCSCCSRPSPSARSSFRTVSGWHRSREAVTATRSPTRSRRRTTPSAQAAGSSSPRPRR